MTASDDRHQNLPQFLHSQDEPNIQQRETPPKSLSRHHTHLLNHPSNTDAMELNTTHTALLCQFPPHIFHNILKFLSSEDLVSCSQVCKFMNHVASDDTLWRRLYYLRWGLLPSKRLPKCLWKTLYMKQDKEDLIRSSRNCQPEFKEYYIEMYTGMRSEAPLLSQLHELEKMNDEQVVVDETSVSQIDHSCSGKSCSYLEINGVFVCENNGQIHICDQMHQEVFWDCKNMLLACRVCGGYFDTL